MSSDSSLVKPDEKSDSLNTTVLVVGLGDYFIHGIGHHLGLDTHDAAPSGDRPLRPGAVITIEPGVYIPEEKLGIRIEDDVLVTQSASRVLSEMIPKRAQDIERAMRS